MISLESFNSFYSMANLGIARGAVSTTTHKDDFEADLKVIKDFSSKMMPEIMMAVFEYLDGNTNVNIASDRKHMGHNFDYSEKDVVGDDVAYDASIIFESKEEFPEDKTKFTLSDFDLYKLRYSTDGNDSEAPRDIFIQGRLQDGRYHPDLIDQFSYTNFDRDGVEDGIVMYSNSKEMIESCYGQQLTRDRDLGDQCFVLDIDRPMADLAEDEETKRQVVLFNSGYALRSV